MDESTGDDLTHPPHDEAPGSRPPSKLRRLIGRLLHALLVITLLLLSVGTVVLVFSPTAIERFAVDRVSRWLAERESLALEVGSIDMAWRERRLVLEELALGQVDEEPFLRVGRAELAWLAWSDLYAAPYRFEKMAFEEVEVNLDAPLPTGGEGGESEPRPLPLSVEQIGLENTVVRQRFEPSRGWMRDWRIELPKVEGQMIEGQIDAGFEAAELVVGTEEGAPLVARVDLRRILGEPRGPFDVEALEARGSGLDLSLDGRLDPGAEGGFEARLELEADLDEVLSGGFLPQARPGVPWPDVTSEKGYVQLAGRLRGPLAVSPEAPLAGVEGELEVEVRRLPAAVLSPWSGEEWLVALDASTSLLALDGRLLLGDTALGSEPAPQPPVRGSMRLRWMRDDEPWLELESRVAENGDTERGGLELLVDGRLLGAEPGSRELVAAVSFPAWPSIDDGRLEARFELTEPELGEALAGYAGRWPVVADALAAASQPAGLDGLSELSGPLTGDLRLAGPLSGPRLRGGIVWVPTDEPGGEGGREEKVELLVDGRLPTASTSAGLSEKPEGEVTLRTYDFALRRLAAFLPQLGGLDLSLARAELDVRLEQRRADPEGEMTLVVRGLGFEAGSGALSELGSLERARIVARLENRWLAADAALDWAAVETLGEPRVKTLRAELEAPFELPVESLRLRLETRGLLEHTRVLDAGVELEDGVMIVRQGRFELGVESEDWAGGGDFSARLPLAGLGEVPALRELLSGLPLKTVGGPLEVELITDPLRVSLPLPVAESEEDAPEVTVDPTLELAGRVVAALQLAPSADPDRRVLRSLGEIRVLDFEARLLGESMLGVGGAVVPLDIGLEPGAELSATLGAGRLELDVGPLKAPSGPAVLRARLPLASLAVAGGWMAPEVLDTLDPTVRALLAGGAAGPLELEAAVELMDLLVFAETLGQLAPGTASQICGRLELALQVDSEELAGSRGRLLIDDFFGELAGHRLRATDFVRLELAEGRLQLEEVGLDLGKEHFVVGGDARLVRARDSVTLTELDFLARGTVPASIFEPYVEGLRASGGLEIDATIGGELEQPTLVASVDGPEAVLTMVQPYRSVVEEPRAELRLVEGKLELETLRARLNDGQVAAGGSYFLAGEQAGDLALQGLFDAVRYRLDYGLVALASGNFELDWPAEGAPELAANILVERAAIRRDVPLARELMSQLFGPGEIPGLDEPDENELKLDISIATVDGLRVRNNLADFRATWNPISVRGTSTQPVISGGVDVEPGGLISLYGQVLRLDHAELTFSGLPGAAPELELQTTSSLEDPTVALDRRDLFAGASAQGSSTELDRALATGFASFAGEQLSDLVSPVLGRNTSISVRPLLIFGESNPDARLAVRRDLSSTLALILAINLRDSQSRTYLVDIHDLPIAPRLESQIFTTEDEEGGATVQQTFELGGGPAPETGDRRLRHLVFDVPPGFETKKLRRAVRLEPGDPLGAGADFDTEIDVAEALFRAGYPAPRVTVSEQGVAEGRADLLIAVDPGPRAVVEFKGDTPPRALASSIRQLYDPVLDDETARAELARRTREVFRGLGHLHPEVTVTIDRSASPALLGTIAEDSTGRSGFAPSALHRVTIETEAGPRRTLKPPRFEGLENLEPGLAEDLAAEVPTQLERVELALGNATAHRRLLSDLRGLGFPEARIVDSRLDGEVPVVVLEPGRRRQIASFEIKGLSAEAAAAIDPPDLEVGGPLRTDRLARAVAALESSLREKGWAEAQVFPWVDELSPASELVFDVELRVEPGERRRLGEVKVSGERATRPGWIERLARLEEGKVLPPRDLVDARRRLLASGLFSRVQVLAEPAAQGEEGAAEGLADVRLEVEEKPRFRLAGGLRWTTDDGLAAVVDVLDRNFTGRAASIGFRGRYGGSDQAARIYGVVPRILASQNDLELFAEVADDTAGERFELSAQLSRRLSRRLLWRVYGRYRSVDAGFVEPDGTVRDAEIPFLGTQLIFGEQAPSELAPLGTFWSLDLSASDSRLGSPQRFLRFFGQLHHHRTVRKGQSGRPATLPFADGPVWSQSLRVGLARAFDETLLRDLRFFTGGDLSVRGYETDRLGPLVPADDGSLEPLGGEALLVINQELRFPVWGSFSGVVFADVGNVWPDRSDFGSDLAFSAGFGIRFASPIGILRLDVGFPIDRRESDDAFEIGIGFGNIF